MELFVNVTTLELSVGASHVQYLLQSCIIALDRNFVLYFLCSDEAHAFPAAPDVLCNVFAQQLQISSVHVSALS